MAAGLDIAIVGMAGRFPGARSIDEFWRNLIAGTESISRFSVEDVVASGVDPALARDARYVKAGGYLDDVEMFDAAFFGYTPREAEVMDPQQRVFLECAWEAFEHAGFDPSRDRRPAGVYAGMSMNSYVLSNLVRNPAAVEAIGEAQAAIANLHDHLATRVSYKLDLRGPSFTVQTACSTSLVAVHLACQGLIGGECDIALAGGVSIGLPQKAGYLYQEGGTHSPDGHCRAFDASAAGMVGGHGAAAVVLKRLEDAIADGDRIWAVIKGTAINNDGASKVGYTAPSVEGQARVVRDALQVAGAPPGTIGYIEAHGTGTPIGDPIEIEALHRVFRTAEARPATCGIGAVKTNVGHLDAAAGVTGLIKTALALHHGVIPPTLHFQRPNPRIDLTSGPFFIVDTLREWKRGHAPRRAGVSSFGIGGTNAHVVLEEAPPAPPRSDDADPQLYVLSARTATALDTARARLKTHLDQESDAAADIAWTLQTGRRQWPIRFAAVGRGLERAARSDEPISRETAFLFPGQGAQYPGMAAALYRRFAGFREPFDRCARAMQGALRADLRALIETSDAMRLAQTELAQPAIFAVEYALAEWMTSLGIAPAAALGHSIGEYVAACIAGVFTLEDAAALVVERGRLMSAAPPGAMTAVALGEREIADWLNGNISVAAVNGPAACVLAGSLEAIAALESRLTRRAIPFSRLRTSHAFHSSLMDGVADAFGEAVSRITLSPPCLPFISNVSGRWIEAVEATDPLYWARHLREPVRFADGLATLAATCTRLIEAGPGTTLSGLARQTLRGRDISVMGMLPRADEPAGADETALAAVGRCWTEGLEINWRALHEGAPRSRVPLPSYPFERKRFWIDPLPKDRTEPRERVEGVRYHVPAWKRRPAPAADPAPPARWLVVADPLGLGRALAERLRRDHHVEVADTIPGDLTRFDAIAYCRAASPHAADLDGARRGFQDLIAIAKALGTQRIFSPLRLEIITANLHDVVGTEALDPLRALLIGPLRVIPQEYPNVVSRNIDVEWRGAAIEDSLIDRLGGELRTPPGSQMVALRGASRWVLGYDPVALDKQDATMTVRAGDTWVIAGGFGTVGLAAARSLAAQAEVRLVLLARDARPDHPAIEELTRAGADVAAIACDVEDEDAVRATLDQVRRRFGSIAGVVHAAGPSGASTFCPIADINDAHVAAQFGAKVRGTQALANAIAAMGDAAPDTVCLASSLASPLGGLGFGAYAAANAAMDAIAARAARDGRARWLSVNWDGWSADGSPQPGAIDRRDGVDAFTALLRHDVGPQVLAVAGDLDQRLARWLNPGTQASGVPASAARPLATEAERIVIEAWTELLGVPGIGADDNFFDLGGQSLLATQLVSRLRRTFQVDVPLRVVFDEPTPRAIAAAIAALTPQAPSAGISARPRGGDAPLSSQQKRLWFLQQLDPGNAAYVIPGAVRIAGPLDIAALQRTLDALVSRHESLRTVIVDRHGEPIARVLEPSAASMRVRDVAGEREAMQLALDEVREPFDLARGPLFRALVLRIAPSDTLVVLAMHHLVSDGWSLGVLVKELVAIYAAIARGREPALPSLTLQYGDFATWQTAWLDDSDAKAQLAYWTQQLADLPRLELIADHPRPAAMTHAAGTAQTTMDATATAAIRDLARATGATPFMVLLAAFAALLHRDTGHTDIPIGTPAANRNRAELEDLIGLFVNSLVIRADVSGAPSFRQLLDRIRRTCLDGWANQDVPFELLVETLQPERTTNQNPLFQVMFVLQNAPEGRLEIPGLTFAPVDLPTNQAKFDLSLYVVETGDTLSVLLEYDRDLVEPDTAERMLGRYRDLLLAAVREPDRAVADLAILQPAERARVLTEWNRTAVEYPRDAAIHTLFSEIAERSPDAVAATFGASSLSYRALDTRSNQLAHALRADGVGRGSIVALVVDRSLGMLVGMLGILKAGAAFLPLDPALPQARLSALLRDAGVRARVTQAEILAAGSQPDTPIATSVDALDLAYVMFTSGSTGVPKGVAVPHRAVVRLVRGARYARFASDEVIMQFAPLAFDASTFEIWGALLNGGTVAIAPAGAPSLHELAQFLQDARVTTAWLTAGLFHQMVEQEIDALGRLRTLIAGGDVLSPAHVVRLLRHAPGLTVVNGFGPTESTTFACCHPMRDAAAVGGTVSIGRPIENSRAYILDARLEPVPIGVPGQLYLGGDGLARGYLNRPDLTAERFIPNPFPSEPGERLYDTGDVARWQADGTIAFVGRRDAQVKIRGFRVEPGEIERAIAAHPAIREAVVVARTAEHGDRQLVAYVVAGDGTADELRAFLRERLPDYMIPSAIVRLDAMPLTANGKIDRRRLPAPERTAVVDYVAPRTPAEIAIARAWSEVLQADRVGVFDNFFELGGHSLLATRVIAHLRDQLQVDIPLRALFAEPTVEGFAAEVERLRALGAHTGPAIQSVPRSATRIRT